MNLKRTTFNRSLSLLAMALLGALLAASAEAQVFDGDLMIGNARGFALLPLPALRATVVDGYEVSGLMSGDEVVMDFHLSGLKVDATQSGSQAPNCGLNTLSLTADATGRVVFFPAVVGSNMSPVANVKIYINGIESHRIRFRTVDITCCGCTLTAKVDILDLNEFRKRFLNVAPYTDKDPDCDFATDGASDGIVDAFDFNIFRTEFLCGVGGAPTPCNQLHCSPCLEQP